MHPAERRRQNILCNQHIPMSVEELLERLLDSDMNTHTGHLGMVEVHLQQPIINQLRYLNVGEISRLSNPPFIKILQSGLYLLFNLRFNRFSFFVLSN